MLRIRIGSRWFLSIVLLATAAGGVTAFRPGILGGETPAELKENLDLPYNAAGADEEEEADIETVVFYGATFEGDGFFFCIDTSLSMDDEAWKTLCRELRRSLLGLSPHSEMGLVFFNETVVAFPANNEPAPATIDTKGRALLAIDEVKPGSGTCLKEGLSKILEMVKKSEAERKVVVLLSDGKPTCPGTDFVSYRADIFKIAREHAGEGTEIHTLGFGNDLDESFLKRLAQENRGEYRRVAK